MITVESDGNGGRKYGVSIPQVLSVFVILLGVLISTITLHNSIMNRIDDLMKANENKIEINTSILSAHSAKISIMNDKICNNEASIRSLEKDVYRTIGKE